MALALVGALRASAQDLATPEDLTPKTPATESLAVVLPPRAGELFRGVDGGVREWWAAELVAAGVPVVPQRKVDAAVAPLLGAEKPFLHGSDAPEIAKLLHASVAYTIELAYDEGNVDVWMRSYAGDSPMPITVGHATGKLAQLGELLVGAARPLRKGLGAHGEAETARLSDLALYERAGDALAAGRPADAVPLLSGVATRAGEALRAQVAAAAKDLTLAPAERSRLASVTGADDRDWLQVRQGLIEGKDPALLIAGATNAEARGERARALELYQQASALAPENRDARVGAARMLTALDRQQEARVAWEGVAETDPENPLAHEALSRNPTLPPRARAEHALRAGELSARRLDIETAQRSFERAGQLSPDILAEARLNVARLNSRVGNDGEALLTYEELASLDPSQLGDEEAETLAGLGSARAAAGDKRGAAEAYDRALRVDPDNQPALEGKGELLLEAGNAAEAVQPLARAVELAPDDSSARRSLARAHVAAGDSQAALGALDANAVPLEERPKILLEAASIQQTTGDLAAARYSLEQAVTIAPDDGPLRSALAKVYGDSGDAEAAAREEASLSHLTGVAAQDPTAAAVEQEIAAASSAGKPSESFTALAESFPESRHDGRDFVGVVFLGIGHDPSAIEIARSWLLPKALDVGAIEAELNAALEQRYALAPPGIVSDIAQPSYERVRDFSTDRADVAIVNDELGAEASFVAKLTSATPLSLTAPLGGPVKVDVRMHTGRTENEVAILAVAMELPSSEKYVRWNPRALLPYTLALLLIALPFLRGWGRLRVKLDYQAGKKAKGFFSIVISRSPGKVTRERESGGSKVAKYQARVRGWSRFARDMAGRETLFKWVPARTYYVCVHGIMQDETGEVVGSYLEERKVKIPRGETVEVYFDFRPKEAMLEVRLLRPEGDAQGVVRVALRGDPTSLKFVKESQAIYYVGAGRHTVVAGYGDCVYEREVEVHDLASKHVTISLGDASEAVFQGCPDAIEPFLMGDLPLCARALDRAGLAMKANELRARYHEQLGDKAEAARFYRAAGQLQQAAELASETEDSAVTGELYEEAGDHRRAAEAYLEGGDFAKAAKAFEAIYEWNDAIEAYKRAGEREKTLELLERVGRHHEAGAVSLQLGDEDRAIRNFQQVDLRDPDYGDACRALADLFSKREEWALAIDRLKEALHSVGEEAAPLELFEQLGDVHEKNGQLAEALQAFETVRKRDYQYPGIADRIRTLRESTAALESQRQSQLQTAAGGGSQTTLRASQMATAAATSPVEERYEILGELGRGGMGVVFKARDRRLGRVVALKRLPENLRDHPTAVALFLREAQSAAALNHPNIVTIYDADQSNGSYYLTMEFLEGFPLDAILKKRGKLSPKDTLRMAVQISTGLQFAHERGLVHRDIKTANLFFTRDRVVKIMDFGLAKMVEEVRKAATVIGGTPYYMAPEQSLGERVDHRADLYAFGVTLFELLTGRVPFKDGDITYHHRHTPPPQLGEIAPETPADLAALVMKLMAKDPAERPATTAEVTAALDGLLRRGE